MKHAMRLFLQDESGEDLIEYGLLAAFVAAVGVLILFHPPWHLMHAVRHVYQQVVGTLGGKGT